ncbi:MAG: hypoxanthine/guanine phosphoribosyltransferase [Methanosphaera sp.]|uniref:hypoxanthine/guanine phosphoribosyltransferase n=1 Tax=Methanosphaera sp. TaxID=2666342 RepID=UPI0025CD474F|nr:hypoxanthine/guanine phosphoribosyltransferase [Methanosphaera sp.]MCI5866768.1 hypoxanthine/guanine phosphoribosyltransferase [Methanosphaera sp.]MDD6534282.1 hypoxanthine/guanine phosphoribosyltransferase [Methanosphaera sp.]MDY3956333.1 hypoxanthine/guanine phosphoribosyltransferase [Methanosphaera sp.]
MLDELKKSLVECPVVKKGEYFYFVHPISDGVPLVEADLLNEIMDYIIDHYNLNLVDKIVGVESMGIPLATALSIKTGIPFVIIRKRSYGLDGECAVHQKTGYGESELYINGINADDNILLIDDVVSTGGTLMSVINALDDIGVNLVYTIVPIEKDDGRVIVEENTGHTLETLVKIKMVDGKVTLVE